MTLQDELDSQRAIINTDEYSMSIGEWISLYERNELDIHPEFQRFYRWTEAQKTRLIESILLGIPIPPIFVSQREDGVWDVIDGLQRLSTILQFVGILRDENGALVSPLVLEKTRYLPSLEGMMWEDGSNTAGSLTPPQRLFIKRSRLNVSIVLRTSDERAKYELFSRLNTGGTPLSHQEMRNAILVMVNRDIYQWMRGLADDMNFQECVALTDRAMEEQYNMELILRFIVFRTLPEEEITTTNIGDLSEFLTDKMLAMAESRKFDYEEEERAFRQTFALLAAHTKDNSFKRYDAHKGRFTGGFLVTPFEVVALGIGYNYEALPDDTLDIVETIKGLWSNEEIRENSGTGIRANTRIPRIVPIGRRLFAP